MQWFYDLKIATKLLLSFTLVALITAAVGWVGLSGTARMHATSVDMYANQLLPIRDLAFAMQSLLLARSSMFEMLAAKDRSQRQVLADIIEQESKKLEKSIESYSKSYLS